MDFLRGLTTPALLVGIARGVVEAAVMAGLGEVLVVLPQIDWGQYAMWSPAVYAGIRALEGLADHIDPRKQRSP